MSYPEGLSGSDYCDIEGCVGRGNCPRCGQVNYRLLGYYGAIASAAKRWHVSEDEAEQRIIENQMRREERDAPSDALDATREDA